MISTSHEIVISRLVYGVSSKNQCENTIKFIDFFNNESNKEKRKCHLDYFSHDPIAQFVQADPDPFYVCGVMLGIAYTGLCHVNEEVLKSAKKIFNEGLNEYNQHIKQETGSSPVVLHPQLILFGEGITQWETN